MARDYLFTSESVSEGHPDKIADRISDEVLDACIKQDPNSKVACECYLKTGLVIVGGEVSTKANINAEKIARSAINEIGYSSTELGLDGNTCAVVNVLGKQSPEIKSGVEKETELGAGDQGLMFGYATDETEVLMPAPIIYSHRLMEQQAKLRKENKISWLRPDAKGQVTFRYEDDEPVAVDTIVVSTQHSPDISNKEITEAVIEEIIKPVIPLKWREKDPIYHINPSGQFTMGGPMADCGLTGRKIIVDSYGGMARHGGGAFSGKDPSKVDRSACYAARYIAKNLVAAKVAKKLEVQISYAIGVADPISINVNTFGTGSIADDKIINIIEDVFNLRPTGIIEQLDLLKPVYAKTSAYGHFGRENFGFAWEGTDKVEAISSLL